MLNVLRVMVVVGLFVSLAAGQSIEVKKVDDGRIRVTIDGDLFTELLTEGHHKPILFPVIGPHGVSMTRHYPIEEAAPGEEADHPHQKSLWFTHGDVNGVDFWTEYDRKTKQPAPDKYGRVVQKKVLETCSGEVGVIRTANEWVAPGGKVLVSDERTLEFRRLPGGRVIDFTVKLKADHGDVTFGETKEGTMAIRTHPALRLEGKVAKGKAASSEGVTGRDVWGKPARWVDYWAPVEGHVVGVAIMDHPANPRHPTRWHARQYGLIGANPFGGGDFDKSLKGTGAMTLKSGDTATFRYRFYFHDGEHDKADVEKVYAEFSK